MPRALRAIAGVDERLLRPVWHERARHTALGGVILGTATVAGLSMWIAINQSLGRASPLAAVPALIWFLFVINLDRLLVTSLVGAGGRRAVTFGMRLAVAAMFGFVIAEPLVMRIFETAIEEHVRDRRAAEIDRLRTRLVSCNGEAHAASADRTVEPACAGHLLSFETTPASLRRELDSGRRQAGELQALLDADTTRLSALRAEAAAECAGVGGPGRTGRVGFGPLCDQRSAAADEFARTHPILELGERLAALRGRMVELERGAADAAATFERERNAKIDARVAEARGNLGPIGFLERMNALHELTDTSIALFVGSWAVRLFFVAVDCLPVFVKVFSGASGYDQLYGVRSAGAQRVFVARLRAEEERIIGDLALERIEAEHRFESRRAELDRDRRDHDARLEMRLEMGIDALAGESRPAATKRG